MARNLATHKNFYPVESPPLWVYNRTVSKCERLANELGGESKIRIAQSAAHLAVECDIIITNLASDDVVKAVYEEFSDALTVRVCMPYFPGIDPELRSVERKHLRRRTRSS